MKSLKAQILSAGELVSSNVISFDLITSVNKIPYAQVVIGEGGEGNKSVLELSNETCFQPGQEIELRLSSPAGAAEFQGIVVKQNLQKISGQSYLTIDIKDSAFKLCLTRESAVFINQDDVAIIGKLAEKAALTVECRGKTLTHQQMVQYYCTNWDFIVSRAEANGLLVCVANGVIQLKKPDLSTATKVLTEVYEYELEVDPSSQYQQVDGVCWDVNEVKPLKIAHTNKDVTLEGNHDFAKLGEGLSLDACVLVSGIPSNAAEMEAWANACRLKSRHALVQGRISIAGNPQLQLGDVVTIAEAGELFSATVLISGIRHRITSNGWTTDLQCGLSSKWFYEDHALMDKAAAGLLPGINGLQIGIVEAYPDEGDPDKVHRIKVKLPAIHEQESVIWARLILPYAGSQRGAHWVPEAGDEVVVGFFNDDPRYPVVLGSLYNGQAEPPLALTKENNEKGFITRSGSKIVFTDEQDKERMEISTPAGNTVLLEDEKGITIHDSNENKIILNDQGIHLEDSSENKITANNKGTVVEDTNKNAFILNKQGIEVKDASGNSINLSSAGIELKDMNGNKVALEAGGVTIQSGANVTVKGSMINLN